MRPAYLRISKIACLATEDSFGSDDLYGVLGTESFALGSYAADDVHADFAEQIIPQGVTELVIAESDFPDPDDWLASIDLTHDMDVDRIHGILTDTARYTVEFRVVSEADEVIDSPCPDSCPTCDDPCVRPASHAGTVHWCGRHGWGAN